MCAAGTLRTPMAFRCGKPRLRGARLLRTAIAPATIVDAQPTSEPVNTVIQ
jgi:hypothetical protein